MDQTTHCTVLQNPEDAVSTHPCHHHSHLTRVTLHLEVVVAFAATEVKYRGVVSYKGDAVARIAATGAEPALLNTHDGCLGFDSNQKTQAREQC